MMVEAGHLALCLALALSVLLTVFPFVGAVRAQQQPILLARPIALLMFIATAFSFYALSYAFWVNDFSVYYVANNSNSMLPWYYRLTAVWGSHEGSMLFWVLILAGWIAAVAVGARQLPLLLHGRILGVLGLVAVGFVRLCVVYVESV
ncbi:MAG: hypothetical protein U5L01_08180 [Rheinheimera sp.]|nr:hypothetical protein [Rheinheimera sp.]